MNDASSPAAILTQLENSLASGNIPAEAIASGERLLQRLNSPVRTVISGLSGSGKSELLNFLAGQCMVSRDATLPPLALTWAKQPQTIVTLHDGTAETHEGIALEGLTTDRAKFVKIRCASPLLKRTSLLEVTADNPVEDFPHAIDWALMRADIILWCSQEFGPQERDLWAKVPETLKDHSFLVLTKADTMSPAEIQTRITALQDVVAEEFHSLIPVATQQAIAATQAEGAVNESALNDSGGAALRTAILRLVELGRRADTDSVLLFLNRYGALSSVAPRPTPVNPPDATGHHANISPAGVAEKTDQNSTALDYLDERAADLTEFRPGHDVLCAEDILQHCTETVDHLVELFAQDDHAAASDQDFHGDIREAADLMLLMQLETGEDAAADAVTLLLQMRRDIEMKLAA